MSKQINKKQKNKTTLVRIDMKWHKMLKVAAANRETTVKDIIEACLVEKYQEVLFEMDKELKDGYVEY